MRFRASRIIASHPRDESVTVLRFSLTSVDKRLILNLAMESQTPIDYWKMFADLMERRGVLVRQRDQAEIELTKTEDQQKANQQAIDELESEGGGLQDAIKLVFSTQRGEWLTASEVRNFLEEMGFDFRQYRTNPLASIATTLKRLVPDYLETRTSAQTGVNYRRLISIAALGVGRPTRETATSALGAIEENRKPKAPVPPPSMRKKLGL